MGGMAINGPTVQASSLANVIGVAETPPNKPSARRVGGKPLELYIARVPGSRDIFLTTLKPRDQVVRAPDVESCLYYCHLETENDELFRLEEDYFGETDNHDTNPEFEIPPSSASSLDEPISPGAHARPPSLPPLAESSSDMEEDDSKWLPALPPRPDHLGTGGPPAIKRKPLDGAHHHVVSMPAVTASRPPLPPRPLQAPQSLNPGLLARPLGPRPLADRRQSENNVNQMPMLFTEFLNLQDDTQKPPQLPHRPASIPSSSPYLDGERRLAPPFRSTLKPGKENFDAGQWNFQTGFNPLPPPMPIHSLDSMAWAQSAPQPASLSPRSTTSSRGRCNSLISNIPTSIRNSHQGFNVILIRRNPSDGTQQNVGKITIPPITPNRYGSPGKVLLQIFTPGYERFRAASSPSTAELVRCLSEDDHCTFSTDLRLATRRRSIKSPTTPYFGDVPVNQLIKVTPSQPYSFLSPWNRVCEFFTGVGGRSLKCRHMLARGTVLDEDPSSMNVLGLSDLRFNTPSTRLFSKVTSPSRNSKRRPVASVTSVPGLHQKSMQSLNTNGHSHVPQHIPNHMTASRYSHDSTSTTASPSTFATESIVSGSAVEEQDWDVEPMDLALGQESAGGGFKGNKAKLGKLVIEPAGLEMLDLLVAANMGIWWSIR